MMTLTRESQALKQMTAGATQRLPVDFFFSSEFYVHYFNFVSRKSDKREMRKKREKKTFFICGCLTFLLLNLLFVFYLIVKIRLYVCQNLCTRLASMSRTINSLFCFVCNSSVFSSLVATRSHSRQSPARCQRQFFVSVNGN